MHLGVFTLYLFQLSYYYSYLILQVCWLLRSCVTLQAFWTWWSSAGHVTRVTDRQPMRSCRTQGGRSLAACRAAWLLVTAWRLSVLAVSQRLPVTSSRHPLPSQASADVESVHLFPVLLPHDAMFNGCLRSETGLAGSLPVFLLHLLQKV